MDLGKLIGIGKKFASLGSGNPATIATSFAPPDSPFAKAAGLGTQLMTAGAAGGVPGATSGSATAFDRAVQLKGTIDSFQKPATGQLDAMSRRRKQMGAL